MNMRDLIPWTRGSESAPDLFRGERSSPFFTLQREMNRLFDEAFRGFDAPAVVSRRMGFAHMGWPRIDVAETEKDITVTAEIPGLEEKDVELLLSDGNLVIRGERKSEIEDKDRQFSECFYGRFERQIPVGADVAEDKIEASFKNGVLKVMLPKTEPAMTKARRIAINNPTKH